ncbi:hypothetical protein, partial [Oleiphilus sp. HI0128]
NKDALYPGMRFAYLHRDWQDYDRLKFEIYSEAPETLNAVLRIHDMKHQNQYHDRFKTRVRIAQGLNQYSIPLDKVRDGLQTRKMEMGQVVDLMLYMYKPKQELTVYIDNIRLESD